MGTNEVISKNSYKKERSDAVTLIITKSQIYTLDIIILHSFDRPKFAAHIQTQILTHIFHLIQWYLKCLMFTKVTFHDQTCVSKSLPITSSLLCLTLGNTIKKNP